MKESEVEKAICDYAKAHGISTLKLSGPNDRGKADRLFMRRGKAMFMEVKAPGKKPTALQLRFLAQRWDDGFAVAWVDNKHDGIEKLFGFFLFDEI